MIMAISMDKKWLAESDAHVLSQYQEIMGDTKRKNAAIKAATTMAADLTKRADAMKKAAGGRITTRKKK